MASFPTKTKEQFLSDIITAWAAILKLVPNLPSGDALRAIFESLVLAGFLFIQSQIVAVSKLTRAATSQGADLDSYFYGDFGFPRIPALAAIGKATFSLRFVSSSNILITPGTVIQTSDGKIQYQVIADTTVSTWSAVYNAYVLVAGQLSLDASIQALQVGSASNVQVGALSQIVTSSAGVNFVTNHANISNGADPEQNQPYRDRFKLFINTVNARTTPAGIYSAAINTPGVVAVSLVENQDISGNPLPGSGLVIIDDGSGAPSTALINAVAAQVSLAMSPARGFLTTNLVVGPVLSTVTIALNVLVDPLAPNAGLVVLNVTNAVINYVNSLSIGQPLYLENVSFVAKNADPFVVRVQAGSVRINSVAADFPATSRTVIRTNNTITTIGIA